MSAFSDRPLVAGSLIGLRAFTVDQLGRLRGPHIQTVFTPRLNEARCAAKGYTIVDGYHRPDNVLLRPTPEHTIGSIDCRCGFYAYFDGTNDYHTPGATIEALIEGFGVCTVGGAGFRASKARLVALVRPRLMHRVVEVKVFGLRFHLAAGTVETHATRHWDLVRTRYRNVPVYDTAEAAIAAHPLTVPDNTRELR